GPHMSVSFRDRVLKLYLLGFDPSEIAQTLSLDAKRKVTEEEVLHVLAEARELLSALPSLEDIRAEVGQALERARIFQKDLLAIYQNMLRNYNAMMEGLTEHPDGTPVIGVRPADIAAMADRIMKIDQERITALLNSLKVLGHVGSTTAGALPSATELVSVEELVAEVADETPKT
uniref:Small terminase protein n=1 Tax=Thermus virus P74-26 TaxID=466052 RepID=UPI001395C9CF|nr:Chain A, Small terminase protein [Oshimavirus P7426]6V1I_B Chain B, Small terminase protein [Oshimavirus P7426]6V1I_C Chain C, Small terminase protein [Oshimavirus P7426]6V1I_D Chain D, Small terminase protein [Oshimavirus P7426]6V1I_E Chain E, Small terminase protein [Oshimavirus P7426]6V1I_F Chain F, Small terminase protein [Oshimavirus P7426]6V1I_G Chain G, Small terminase protein [Oshimavirus P7426]6V1I_H Chain H, Small terminase protein [Oshimavirus P7426]6V1I_I Chain I, Small termi